jgi:hypothetical protein
MQNRYVGDIGDFAKYSLINALTYDQPLGIAWYLFPDEGHNSDGKHISYLEKPEIWRRKDPKVIDGLKGLMAEGNRQVSEVTERKIVNATYISNELLQSSLSSYIKRADWRKAWFDRTQETLKNAKAIFVDPDNGLCLCDSFNYYTVKHWKRLPMNEVFELSSERTAIIYHHNSRFKGGHVEEIKFWLKQLPENSFAIRYRAYSARTFFVINSLPIHYARAREWVENFGDKADMHQLKL